MPYKIRLTDGNEYNVRLCAARNGMLVTTIQSYESFMTVANNFAGNTQTVVFCYDSTEDVFTGYTELVSINGTITGEYTITLRQGE